MPRHKRDWKQYNKHLINRGNINLWVTKKALKFWHAKKTKKNGRPFTYSDEAIKTMLVIRFKYKLPLRELEGIFHFLAKVMNITQIPSYTQVCRRMRSIQLPEELVSKREITDLVLDTTGLKIFGAGEWCQKRYGGKAKWKKLHLAMDPKGHRLVLAEATHKNRHDTTLLGKALSKSNKRKGRVLIDGIADQKKSYEISHEHNKKLITPPKRNARLRKELIYENRNEAIKMIKGLGGDELARSIWGKLTGYSRRSLIESKIAQWKMLLGGEIKSRSEERIENEITIKAMILNEMVDQRKSA